MSVAIIKTEGAPLPVGPYSQGVAAGGMLFVSGQIALDPSTGAMIQGDIKDQTRRAMENLKEVLAAAGSGLERAVKTTIFITDMEKFSAVNEVYGEYFTRTLPARTTVEVSRLPKDALVEIDCIAII